MHNTATPYLSIVLPCLNEEAGIGICIDKIQKTCNTHHLSYEIIVCDNGSTDNSVAIAESFGVRVIHEAKKGYGNAYITGFAHAHGTFFIMGDADDTYDFTHIPRFVEKLCDESYDFVTGTRFVKGNVMPFFHRFLGNPLLTVLLNIFFGAHYTDVYCGFRAFRRDVYARIAPISPGMEFNLELAINASLAGLNITEIPITLHPRKGESKLNTVTDGWRSLRMMMLYCPNVAFLFPGAALLTSGLLFHIALMSKYIQTHAESSAIALGTIATLLSVVGFQIISLGVHVKTYSWSRRFDRHNSLLDRVTRTCSLEKSIIASIILMLLSSSILVRVALRWIAGEVIMGKYPGLVSFSVTLMIISIGLLFTALSISALSIGHVAPKESHHA